MKLLSFLANAVAAAALLSGCGADGHAMFSHDPGDNPHTDASTPRPAPCTEGSSRECGVTLGNHDGVLSCYHGTQACVSGTWAACGKGQVENRKSPQSLGRNGLHLTSLSSPVACVNNPCDPSCQVYNETPDGGWGAGDGGGPIYTWQGGTLADYPSSVVKKGSAEPCQTGGGCQFNQQCYDVATGISCGHDKCATGTPLGSTCDSCVKAVCAVDSTCCADSTCAHDVCVPGVKLDSTCSACTTSVCAAHPACCTATWDNACTGWAQSICGACTCATGQVAYGGHCYFLNTASKKWSDARTACAGLGLNWDLVEITGDPENTFLQTQVAASDGWIGINDTSDVGIWQWANGDSPTYTKWNTQPDNGHGTDEDCTLLRGSDGLWSDESCALKKRYVCEAPEAGATCPAGQTHNNANGHCYKVITTANKWATQSTACIALGTGWNLAEVDDAAENGFVQTLTAAGTSYWTGLNDSTTEGSFVWQGGGAAAYTNWGSQPDGGVVQNCAMLARADSKWSDEVCTLTHGYACEGPLLTSCPDATWTLSGSKCFKPFTATTSARAAAETSCVGLGGHLATAASAAENTVLSSLSVAAKTYWIGYTDAATEGTWLWQDGSAAAYTAWSSQPDGGAAQNCGMFGLADGAWTDELCTNTHDYVCEGPQTATCPDVTWTLSGGRCLKAYTTTSSRAASEATCVTSGGHLASIASGAENTTIGALTAPGKTYWLGYTDAATEGTWLWQDGSAATYTAWSSQPDGAAAQNCGMLGKADGAWTDEVCSSTHTYECEGPPLSVTCPAGWTQSGSKCFLSSGATTATWAAAETACVAQNGHLASIANAGENGAVKTVATATAAVYWIGGTDAATEGTWTWSDGTPSVYNNWASDPNGNTVENCAVIQRADGTWADVACATAKKTVCETNGAVLAAACVAPNVYNAGHCYRFVTTTASWATSQLNCRALALPVGATGWDLAVINDATENNYIKTTMVAATVDSWIAYTDDPAQGTVEGSWIWKVSNGMTSAYTNWHQVPDGGAAQNCRSFDGTAAATAGTWNDDDCTGAKRYVCELTLPSCTPGTTLNGGRCYKFGATARAWSGAGTTAQSDCQSLGAGFDIADITSAAENTYLRGQITADSWIGYTDAAVEGTWKWSSGSASAYTNWRPEPDGGVGANCADMDGTSDLWHDDDCSVVKNFVCETTPGTCPIGTVPFNGECYKFGTTARAWSGAGTTAQSDCRAIATGYDLATINDALENAWIKLNAPADSWIGYTDAAVEGTWVWANGVSAFTNWRSEPDGGAAANCADFDGTSHLWHDDACATAKNYFCQVPTTTCPTGAVALNGECYKFVATLKTSAAAQADCQTIASSFNLATIDNAVENALVSTQITVDSWIGYSDAAVEGTWSWANGSASTYTSWRPEPDGGVAENCVSLANTDGRWNDEGCTLTRNAICEGPDLSNTPCRGTEKYKNGKCYYYGTTTATWAAAEAVCEAGSATISKGTLTTVFNQAENDYVQGIVTSGQTAWVGFNDQTTEGTFTWKANEGSTFTDWMSDPNDDTTQECSRIVGADGTWSSELCTATRPSLCEGPSSAGNAGSWTQSCVDKVATVCDATCGSGTGVGAGTCVPWLPSQTESYCAAQPDLAVGVGCTGSQVPVCNHGGTAAPAGVTIAWFTPGSGEFKRCNPDLSKRQDPSTCVVNVPIPAGECVTITCPGMVDGAEIMVNPPDATHIAECSCLDDWSLYDATASCGPPECSAGVSQSTIHKVNMYFIVDRSNSMAGGKWDGLRTALAAFFADPQSAGLGIALEFFPLSAGAAGDASGDGCGMDIGTCASARCGNPYVPLGTLTAAAAPADTQEAALVAPLIPNWLLGSTPSWPALSGALDWATARQTATPNETNIVVFATDGQPAGSCIIGTPQNTNDQLAVRAANAFQNFGVRTYTIGMIGANNVALDKISDGGGGGKAFVIDSTDPAIVATQLSTALQAIAGQNVSCTFPLPNKGLFDPNKATITDTDGAGTVTTLKKVSSLAACGLGWYFDDPRDPTKAALCPDSCTSAKLDTTSRIEIHVACPSYKTPGKFNQVYEGKCPVGTTPQWGYLSYDTTVPPNTSLEFKVRVAPTQADLASASFVSVAAVPSDPTSCLLSGPSPCPKDLFMALGGNAETRYHYLEVEVDTTPHIATNATVDDFKITYSCLPSQ